jgi:hypothetical protein
MPKAGRSATSARNHSPRVIGYVENHKTHAPPFGLRMQTKRSRAEDGAALCGGFPRPNGRKPPCHALSGIRLRFALPEPSALPCASRTKKGLARKEGDERFALKALSLGFWQIPRPSLRNQQELQLQKI